MAGTFGIFKNPNFASSFKQTLETYPQNSKDYLYDLEPQSNNLFWAGYFAEGVESDRENEFYDACYRIRKVSIPMLKLDFEIDKNMQFPAFRGGTGGFDVQIDWFEDVYHTVLKYHSDWAARWYNREKDCWVTGKEGKFRKLVCVAYHYFNANDNSPIEVPEPQPILAFKIGGLVPTDLPALSFDKASDQADSMLSLNYKCGKVEGMYQADLASLQWDPKGVQGSETPDDKTPYEKQNYNVFGKNFLL